MSAHSISKQSHPHLQCGTWMDWSKLKIVLQYSSAVELCIEIELIIGRSPVKSQKQKDAKYKTFKRKEKQCLFLGY
jgi:hypothetical protein